jgi:hypothetical protein
VDSLLAELRDDVLKSSSSTHLNVVVVAHRLSPVFLVLLLVRSKLA